MSYRLPTNGQWVQKNLSDSSGLLWSSFNLDLTRKQGDVKITRLIHNLSTSTTESNMGIPVAFAKVNTTGGFSPTFWAVAGSRVFNTVTGLTSASFVQDATSGTPTVCNSGTSDLCSAFSKLYVSTLSNVIYVNNAGTWSNFNVGTVDETPHALCQYGDRVYMQKFYSQIASFDSAHTVATSGQYTLTLPNPEENTITFMKSASDRIWIGTVNRLGGQGHVYSWDGNSGNPVKYTLSSSGAMAGVIKDDVLHIVDNGGKMLAFNGGTFVEVARLPNYRRYSYYNALSSGNDRWIHPNGMDVVEGKICVLVNLKQLTYITPNLEESAPSGIWEYDKDIGLYHKYSFSYLDTDVGTVSDYGQSRISDAGALLYAKPNSDGSLSNGTILAGCKYYTNNSSTLNGIFFDDNNDSYIKAGYLVTSKIPSSAISDEWQKLVLKYNPLISSSNKIVVKYRLTDYEPIEATVNWLSDTKFTTTTDISAYGPLATGFYGAYGGEVEVVQGVGAGFCSHITELQSADGAYIVTLDTSVSGAVLGAVSIARFQKWNKIGLIENNTTSTYKIMPFPSKATSNYIQLKIWMLMYGSDELKEVDIASVVSQPL